MPARVERFPFPQRPDRQFIKPVLGWAFVAAVLALIRRYTHQPSLPRMSGQWMLSHQSDFNRAGY